MHSVTKQPHIFTRLAVVLSAMLLLALCLVPTVAAERSGKVDGMEWSLIGGVLTVSGKAIPDFTEENPAPWASVKDEINRVELKNGIAAVGAMAFFECPSLAAVYLPTSVKTVGAMAFAGCTALKTAVMPSVTHIGEYAFSRCFSLGHAVLPTTLTQLDRAAFYRCESLRSVTVPASVTQMGDSVFAYCAELLDVNLQASLSALPEWTFYGCEKLTVLTLSQGMTTVGDRALERCDALVTVYQQGETNEEIKQSIHTALPDVLPDNVVAVPEQLPPATDTVYTQKGDKMHGSDTVLQNRDGVVIEITTEKEYPLDANGQYGEVPTEGRIDMAVTLTDKAGWDALGETVEQQVFEQGVLKSETKHDIPLTATVTMMNGSKLSGAFLRSVAGQNIVLQVNTPDGCRWRIDCSLLKGYTFQDEYDMTYTRTYYQKMSDAHRKVLGAATAYWLSFADRIDFPATVDVYMDTTVARQTATLYEKTSPSELKRLQSVVAGANGVIAYPMANVNKGEQYLLAFNVGTVIPEDVIHTDKESTDGDWLENYVPITDQYIITDVKGFLGLTMKQFTWIVVGAVGGLALVVFVIALLVNMLGKKKALDAYRKQQR